MLLLSPFNLFEIEFFLYLQIFSLSFIARIFCEHSKRHTKLFISFTECDRLNDWQSQFSFVPSDPPTFRILHPNHHTIKRRLNIKQMIKTSSSFFCLFSFISYCSVERMRNQMFNRVVFFMEYTQVIYSRQYWKLWNTVVIRSNLILKFYFSRCKKISIITKILNKIKIFNASS